MEYLFSRPPEKWYAQLPIYNVGELKQAVFVLTEYIEVHGGILSTCLWEVYDNYLDHDCRILCVVYQRYI